MTSVFPEKDTAHHEKVSLYRFHRFQEEELKFPAQVEACWDDQQEKAVTAITTVKHRLLLHTSKVKPCITSSATAVIIWEAETGYQIPTVTYLRQL